MNALGKQSDIPATQIIQPVRCIKTGAAAADYRCIQS